MTVPNNAGDSNSGPERVLLVVPCFRESIRLPKFLPELCRAMDALGAVDVCIVDDGSGSDEQQSVREFIDSLRPTAACLEPPLMLETNHGKGGAIYAGWRTGTSCAWLGFVDADGSCPASEVSRMISHARGFKANGASPPALFASRIKMLGRNVDRLLSRHLVGRVYATLVSELLRIPVYDSQCGLKLVPRAAFEAIQNRLTVEGFAFDVDLLVALLDSGCAVQEFPIDWHEKPGGSVRLFRDPWRMAWDVWRIRQQRSARLAGARVSVPAHSS